MSHTNSFSRRKFLIGSGGALAAAFLPATEAEAKLYKALPGNPAIRGTLTGLSLRQGQRLNSNSLKLVYFGMPWNTGCAADLLVIQDVVRRRGIAGQIDPIFIYPQYQSRGLPSPDVLRSTIRAPGSPFKEVSGPAQATLQVAANYRTRYFSSGRPISTTDTRSIPDSHTRFTFLMSADLRRNLAIFKPDPFDFEMETILKSAIQNKSRNTVPALDH